MKRVCAFLAVFIFVFSAVSQAGCVSFDRSFPDNNHVWNFTGYDGDSGNDAVPPVEIIYPIGPNQTNADYKVVADLTFHATKTVENGTFYDWTSHGSTVDGNGGATFVDIGGTSSNIFNSHISTPLMIKETPENSFSWISEFFPF